MDNIFVELTNVYGTLAKYHLKKLLNFNYKLAAAINQRIFLLRCKQLSIIPKHINNNFKCLNNVLLKNNPYKNLTNKIVKNFQNRILNLEIKIACWRVNFYERKYYHFFEILRRNVSFIHWNKITSLIKRKV